MMMNKKNIMVKIIFTIVIILTSLNAMAADHSFVLSPRSEAVLNKWLSKHTNYRLANIADCGCSEDVKQMQKGSDDIWKGIPNYHPYRLEADLNSDGQTDIAVVFIDKSKKIGNFAFAVFNGPFSNFEIAEPIFFETGMNLEGHGIFFGPPRPKPYRLILGRFESEGMRLKPKGSTYVWDKTEEERE